MCVQAITLSAYLLSTHYGAATIGVKLRENLILQKMNVIEELRSKVFSTARVLASLDLVGSVFEQLKHNDHSSVHGVDPSNPDADSEVNASMEWHWMDGLRTRMMSNFVDSSLIHDLLLIDTDGKIVFTVQRESDLGTNLFDGPYSGSILADGYKEMLRTREPVLTGHGDYAPSQPRFHSVNTLGVLEEITQPRISTSQFAVVPVYSKRTKRMVGSMALQLRDTAYFKYTQLDAIYSTYGIHLALMQRDDKVLLSLDGKTYQSRTQSDDLEHLLGASTAEHLLSAMEQFGDQPNTHGDSVLSAGENLSWKPSTDGGLILFAYADDNGIWQVFKLSNHFKFLLLELLLSCAVVVIWARASAPPVEAEAEAGPKYEAASAS